VALVLCTGANLEVMQARQEFLQRAGHRVVTAMNEKELSDACNKYQFDVVVIGHTLSKPMKQRVVDLIRQHCPDVKVLELYPITIGRAIEDADSWIESAADAPQKDVPGEIAERVAELAKAS
jgi:CheY-like chemotaxis protein